MLLLGIWITAALMLGACWALAGLLLGPPTESPSRAVALESDGEAA